MSFKITLILTAALLISAVMPSKTQNAGNDYDLLLRYGNINLAENLDDFISGMTAEQVYKGRFFKYIQFYDIPGSQERSEMEELGLRFIDYLPNNTYTVEIPESFNRSLLTQYGVRSVENIRTEYKLAPDLQDGHCPEWALRPAGKVEIMVSYFSSLNFTDFEETVALYDILSISRDEELKIEILQIATEKLELLAAEPFVYFVEPIYPPGEPENYTGKTLHHSNMLNSEYSSGRHYDGTGIKVMLQDDGIIGPHIDFDASIGAQYLTNNNGDHGDHIAGTILGAGNLDPTTRGMAPGAEIYVYTAGGYQGFSLIPTHYSNPGIRISSTSYSNGCNAGYTTLARTMDNQVRMYPSLMHVFSAGNSGTSDCGYGAGAGWGNITGGHKVGKNVIAVANLDYKDALSNSSSRGPAHDGRIKPDLAAKGSSVYSTTDPNDYTTKSGTSMACPGVSGSFAQLYHAYKELNNQQEPAGGLIKAITMNTAEDLGNPGPDFMFGWGRINNLRAVLTLEEDRYLEELIDQGEQKTHSISVPSNIKELRVMVYWTDWEASVGTNLALVNNINMTVTDPQATVHYPWVLSHYPHPDSLNKPAANGIDNRNNVEQVSIQNPIPGQYQINLTGFAIPMGPQPYFVVFEYLTDDIIVTYPAGGESFKPSESAVIRWDTYGNNGTFSLEYSPDGGQSWTTINASIGGDRRYYNWTTPQAITGAGIIKVSRNGVTGQSAESFSVMHIPSGINFDYSCPNSVQLSWNSLPEAEYYTVFRLIGKYMEEVGTTTADSIVIGNVNANDINWFSVSAVGPGNAKGRRELAKMKEPGVWNCTFSDDVAVSEMISPPAGILFDCLSYDNIPVAIEIYNTGLTAVQGVPVSFRLNNGNIVQEEFAGAIEPGEAVIHEFSSHVSLMSGGNYSMEAWVSYPGDENVYNDTIFSIIQLKPAQYYTAGTTETFDDITSCSYAPDCGETFCNLDARWYNLENYVDDHIDWRALNGITPTQGTGPIGDHTTGTIQGKFLYLEASGECYHKKAVLMSPCIDLNGYSSPTASIWYHMHGADMGKLHFDVIHNGKLIKDVVPPIAGNQGSDWNELEIDLSPFAGSVINMRFRGTTGDGELSDLAIDDFSISDLTTGVAESGVTGKAKYTVVPNPSAGMFRIESDDISLSPATIKVTDLFGKVIFTSDATSFSSSYLLDISHYPDGLYLLMIQSDEDAFVQKIIKESKKGN